jgi:hypothetical protein
LVLATLDVSAEEPVRLFSMISTLGVLLMDWNKCVGLVNFPRTEVYGLPINALAFGRVFYLGP